VGVDGQPSCRDVPDGCRIEAPDDFDDLFEAHGSIYIE